MEPGCRDHNPHFLLIHPRMAIGIILFSVSYLDIYLPFFT